MAEANKLEELVAKLRETAGRNLVSLILYGSAAAGDHIPEQSDTNLLCVLADTSYSELTKLRTVIEWWTKEKNRPPLLMGMDELRRAADVFSIELLDMQQSYKILAGEDVLKTLVVPTHFHRAQLEYELREKTILLRQAMLSAGGNPQRLRELLVRSLPGFVTLFRHALLELGQPAAASKKEAVEKLSKEVGFDPSAFLEVLSIRERKTDASSMNVEDLFARYLKTVEEVTSAVDKILESEPGIAGRKS